MRPTQTSVDAALRTAHRIIANEKVEGDYVNLEGEVVTLALELQALRDGYQDVVAENEKLHRELLASQNNLDWANAVNKELMKSQESLARDLVACRESKRGQG